MKTNCCMLEIRPTGGIYIKCLHQTHTQTCYRKRRKLEDLTGCLGQELKATVLIPVEVGNFLQPLEGSVNFVIFLFLCFIININDPLQAITGLVFHSCLCVFILYNFFVEQKKIILG